MIFMIYYTTGGMLPWVQQKNLSFVPISTSLFSPVQSLWFSAFHLVLCMKCHSNSGRGWKCWLSTSDAYLNRLCFCHILFPLRKMLTIHQVTTMLATSKNALFPGYNHLLTTSTDDPTLWLLPEHQQGSSVPVVSRWLWPGNMTFLEVARMVIIWWILAFLRSVHAFVVVWLLLTFKWYFVHAGEILLITNALVGLHKWKSIQLKFLLNNVNFER